MIFSPLKDKIYLTPYKKPLSLNKNDKDIKDIVLGLKLKNYL